MKQPGKILQWYSTNKLYFKDYSNHTVEISSNEIFADIVLVKI